MLEDSPGLFEVDNTMMDIAYHFSAMDLYDEEFNIVNLGRQNIDERRDKWTHLSTNDLLMDPTSTSTSLTRPSVHMPAPSH
jgi:hypothetical protein